MKQGVILKGVGGYYTVLYDKDKQCVLKARGKFRAQEQTPWPGDIVRFVPPEPGVDGAMGELLPRRNLLLRPKVANVDLLFAVISAQNPPPDYLLLDKLCANAMANDIQVVAVLNKCELIQAQQREAFLHDYASFTPLCVSTKTGQGQEALQRLASGRICCFAGQSGVGKTSLVNMLLPEKALQTGALSQKTGRGRHTTRHAELICTQSGGMIVDTPGFSLMELPLMEPQQLMELVPEFAPYLGQCRFTGCVHHHEPGCAVKAAVEAGAIPQSRYARYVTLLEQVQHKWRNRYE